MTALHQPARIITVANGLAEARAGDIAVEAEVTLVVNNEDWLNFRCSPDDLEALAAGYLYNEGFIHSADEIAALHVCAQRDHVDVWLAHAAQKPAVWGRTSGCQGGTVPANLTPIAVVSGGSKRAAEEIVALVERFMSELAGPERLQHGVHTSMLIDAGEPVRISSDIGRHNTLDKIAGDCLTRRLRLSDPALITTGRISSDMVYKAARMNIPLLLSLHSISHLAVQAAEEAGITLIGHARRKQFDLYTHPERIRAA